MLMLATAPAMAANDATEGEALAHKACGSCHVTDPAQRELPPVRAILHARPAGAREIRIPTFAEIANRPGMNPQSLHRFIESTHWEKNTVPASAMPQPPVTPEQEAKIIAYLLSFKKSPSP
jgi:cytochrome c2